MVKTAFELLGIENKEVPISNLLSYYLDPNTKYGSGFLNEFCKMAGISPILTNEIVTIEREHRIFFENENNYIDILIKIGKDEANPDRIICIENKINSTEGLQQTRRYYNALQSEFPRCTNRQYIYLTKNNSSVDLSSQHFIHLRYSSLGNILARQPFEQLPLATDFYEYYILREQNLFNDIETNDKSYIIGDRDDFHTLIDYIVWKTNNSDFTQSNNRCFCLSGKSAQSNNHFYQISMQNWEFEFDDGFEKRPMSIHLEGNCQEIPLHLEMKPYEPFNKLEKRYGSRFFESYLRKRNELRDILIFEGSKSFESIEFRKNAELTIAKFKIHTTTYKQYYNTLMELVNYVNQVLFSNGVIK